MKLFLLTGLLAGCLAAPQYGPGAHSGGGSSNQNQRAPVSAPVCRTEYTTIWDTEYVETETQECNTIYVNECNTLTREQCRNVPRKECRNVPKKECRTEYRDVCEDRFRTVNEPYTETECMTRYKEDCEYQWEGQGQAKVWVPIAGTCKTNPYESCNDVNKQRERQVADRVCNKVIDF